MAGLRLPCEWMEKEFCDFVVTLELHDFVKLCLDANLARQ